MKAKYRITRKMTFILLLSLIMAGIFFMPATVHAAGWLGYAQQTINLGTMVTDSIKTGDYYGPTEGNKDYYWHIYKFFMPKKGLLNIYIESESKNYFNFINAYSWAGYAIFSASNPDDIVWRCRYRENEIEDQFSAPRSIYYGSTEIALNQGEYYFAVRQKQTCDTPYYLTLSYKEPDINVTSISLDKKALKLEPGEQAILTADILPDNATDKTLTWKSSDSSVASVEDATVTACSPGMATITATSSDGEVSASCAVTIINTPAIDELEESRPSLTAIHFGKRKLKIYYAPIHMDDVKYQVSYKTSGGKWKIKNTAGSPVTIRSLIPKKTYYIRVRGYKKIDGSVYYSDWSYIKKVKTNA